MNHSSKSAKESLDPMKSPIPSKKDTANSMKHSVDPMNPLSPLNHMIPLPQAETLLKALIKRCGKYSWIPILILGILWVALWGLRQYHNADCDLVPMPVYPELRIRYLDVGQADSILLICEGKTMLIDGGNVGDGDKVCEVLEEEQIQTLDYLVCTHAHEDHVGGLAAVLKECDANTVFSPVTEYDSRAFRNFAKEAEEITVPNVGDRFDLGGAKVQVLACDPYAEDVNNTSIVLKVSYGQTSFLFTGDAEYPVEEKMLDMGFDPSATVLKVGHHGSSSSTSYRFLNTVMPQYAVISVGVENTYKHPEDVILSRLRDADVKTFRTDLDGDLYCTSDGRKVTFQTPEPSINNQP